MQPTETTNPSIFVRLREDGSETRELAWEQFDARYRPMMVAFARKCGLGEHDADDVAQEVMFGFFVRSPTFVYDPAKGRFRHYLKTCTRHAILKRFGSPTSSLDQAPNLADKLTIDQTWNDIWEREALRQAIDAVRVELGPDHTSFKAFERFVMFEEPAQVVATHFEIHLNSVYRARDQILQLLHRKLNELKLDLD